MSKNRIEQIKPAHKVIDVVDDADSMICVIFLWYNVKNTKKFLCSSPIFCNKDRGREIATISACEI